MEKSHCSKVIEILLLDARQFLNRNVRNVEPDVCSFACGPLKIYSAF